MRNGNAFQLIRQWRTNYNRQVIPKSLRAIGNKFCPRLGMDSWRHFLGADIVTKLSTGKSIGEHLDAAIEERYDIDNGVLLEW